MAPQIPHVASYAFSDRGKTAYSAAESLLRREREGARGILTGLEMAGMRLRGCQLVVLSACETGLSDSTYGDGLLGMQRSLTLAGSRSQLLSLWRVPAAATARLMDEFYGRLMGGSGKAEALRGAKDAMRREGRPVWEWAGWVLYGDPGPIHE